jgi:hypothetical protein
VGRIESVLEQETHDIRSIDFETRVTQPIHTIFYTLNQSARKAKRKLFGRSFSHHVQTSYKRKPSQ